MFKKILIANRGEIAVRIIRACKEMDIATVAIYSTGDKEALHVQLADEAICVGSARATESYLNMENILSAAALTGAQAIHPGYGFLSENPKFARLVKECGFVFIGPDADVIEEMGDKARARQVTLAAGVPVVPGSEGNLATAEEALQVAEEIGYPVLIKATSGGGGKGMRVVENKENFTDLFHMAKTEARANFGDDNVYLEKYVQNPKHIEFQLMGDSHGNYVHLFERDCSVQRNHQKLIEEAPCRSLSEKTRKAMAADVIKLAQATKYNNAGTLEFIVDKDENYYFIEMNTRIQVEHPVTEMVTGIDLIKEQIKVAAGAKLSFTQEDIKISGYSMECRINAEDPLNGFRPSTGKINQLILPGGFGVRVDTMIYSNYSVSPFYDSLILKLIIHGKTRLDAIKKMRRALEELIIDGIITNNEFHYYIMHHVDFVKGDFDTSFVGKFLEELAEDGELNA